MGRTLPSAMQVFDGEAARWAKFRRALRREDQEILDELFLHARRHVAAMAYASSAVPMEAVLLAMLLEERKVVNRLGAEGIGRTLPVRYNQGVMVQQGYDREAAMGKIRGMVRLISDRFRPEKVILFGSYARGEAGPDSDADLLVVMRLDDAARRRMTGEIASALADAEVPKDVIVMSPDYLERYRGVPGTLAFIAAGEGQVLYERAA